MQDPPSNTRRAKQERPENYLGAVLIEATWGLSHHCLCLDLLGFSVENMFLGMRRAQSSQNHPKDMICNLFWGVE